MTLDEILKDFLKCRGYGYIWEELYPEKDEVAEECVRIHIDSLNDLELPDDAIEDFQYQYNLSMGRYFKGDATVEIEIHKEAIDTSLYDEPPAPMATVWVTIVAEDEESGTFIHTFVADNVFYPQKNVDFYQNDANAIFQMCFDFE